MPRRRPPFLIRRVTRHGAVAWYFWRRPGPQIRIRGEYGSPDFMAQYEAALAGEPLPGPKPPAADSLAWLIDRYLDSAAWSRLAPSTRADRARMFARMAKTAGDLPFASLTADDVIATREAKAKTPGAANNFLIAMRALFSWAIAAGLAKENPAAGVRGLRVRSEGFHVWTEEEVARFEARWPLGTRERLALAILLYTGLRRGDAARLGRQHVKAGVIRLRAEKTGTPLTIPILPPLQAAIDAAPGGGLAFICKGDGQPMSKASFGNWFREACRAAGVPGAAHGLRKAGATRAAEAGATIHELNALFGWTDTRTASVYTAKADRARLARAAAGKMARRRRGS